MKGLLLTHFFVEEKDASTKYDWVQKAILKNLELNEKFYIVLSGHGVVPPKNIEVLVDKIYWSEEILYEQIGRGHPNFCIEGFKLCQQAGCDFTLKNRAYDYIENSKVLSDRPLITEQSSKSRNYIGDLLMYGPTSYMLDWWKRSPWDYSVNGMVNLFRNTTENFINEVDFVSIEDIGWKTFEGGEENYWGKHAGYDWYNGDGFKK
tara:strand:+ start:3582 stop:4199 length:618 start_codon:yes stop_codon:yes gene_type:complete